MSIACTILTPNRVDEYGRPLYVGQEYVGPDDLVKSMHFAGAAKIKDFPYETDTALETHLNEHATIGVSYPSKISSSIALLRDFPATERGSSGTWQTLFMGATDFVSVSPIICVTRAPTDATYTNDDIYDAIAAAPTNQALPGGLPDSSEGGSSWQYLGNQAFARQSGASASNPVWVQGNPIPCMSVPRVDGHPGRLALLRAYTPAGSHALAATTRMPTYRAMGADLATLQRWDTQFPFAAHGQYYFKAGDYASWQQGSYGAASPTRWIYTLFGGCKFHYIKPVCSILSVGCSLEGGDYNETGIAVRASWGVRAAYKLLLEGRAVDHSNVAISGARWDTIGPQLRSLVTSLQPDVLLLPAYCPNGVTAGSGSGLTLPNAYLHLQQAMFYADWALNNGVRNVIFLMPLPWTAGLNIVHDYIRSVILQSGLDYFDPSPIVGGPNGGIGPGYTFDGEHPNALANDRIAEGLAYCIRKYAPKI